MTTSYQSLALKRSRFRHAMRWASQWAQRPSVAIIGGYHGGNLGDCALGLTTASFASEYGLNPGLQTIYTLDRWRPISPGIVGGGAVAHSGPLSLLERRFGGSPQCLAFVGVDFNDDEAALQSRDLLKAAAVITCRSESQAQRLRRILGRRDIVSHHDIVFAHRGADAIRAARRPEPLTVGVNVAPFFYRREEGRFVPGSRWRSEVEKRQPHLAARLLELGPAYRANLRACLAALRQRGCRIVHFPFTFEDDLLARELVGDLVHEFRVYDAEPTRVLTAMARCERFLPTRFHSLVFSMLAGVPFAPFAYAVKSEALLDEMHVAPDAQIRGLSLLDSDEQFLDAIARPHMVRETLLADARESAAAGVRRAYETITGATPSSS